MRMWRVTVLTAWIVCTLGFVHAQTENLPDTDTEFTPAPSSPFPELAQDPTMLAEEQASRISISLDDVELIDVVRMFSSIADANIIADPELLTARVTVNLDNVEWRPALSSILSMHGLALVERPQGSGVFTVLDQPPDAPVPMITETIFLNYTTVDDVKAVVDSMRSSGSSLSLFPSRNAMVLRDTEGNISEIKQIIDKIDVLARQVVVETQFIELDDRAANQLGIRWDSLDAVSFGFTTDPIFGTVRDSERSRTREDTLSRVDDRQRTDSSSFETDAFGDTTASTREQTDVSDLSREARSEITERTARTVATASEAVLDMGEFNFVMSALKQTDGASIVSNPKIVVTSGSTNAFFSVGDREPIIRRTLLRGTTDAQGDQILAELDTDIDTDFISGGYLNTGIELLVVPTVKTDDLIEARIEPSLRRQIGVRTVADNEWPRIAVKEIRTHFTLKSGQTVAIGGLTDTRDEQETSKVPLLGDIPIIGKYLFSHTREVQDQRETIIFVTLSLADPADIQRNEGMPRNAHLVHQREIRDRMRRLEQQQELDELERTADELEQRFERQQQNRQTIEEADPPNGNINEQI